MIDFYDLLRNGASEENIQEVIDKATQSTRDNLTNELSAAKARIEAEQEKAAEELQTADTLSEARANLINAFLAYNEVFHFVDAIDEDSMEGLEKAIIDMEKMFPLYARLLKLEEKFNSADPDGVKGLLDTFFGEQE